MAALYRMRSWIAWRLVAVVCLIGFISACGGSGEGTIDRNSSGGQETIAKVSASRDHVVGHATVVRVDAETGAVEAVVPVGPDPLLLAVASGRIWTLNLGDGTLSRVEPSSNEARTVRRGVVVGIASDNRDLWLARDGNVVSRLDGATGQTEISFALGPKPLFALRDAGFLGIGTKSVWLTVPRVGEPSRAAQPLAP